jgi:hypothetical protein
MVEFLGTDADRHDGSHNGISKFGGNADSAETADLGPVLINAQIALSKKCMGANRPSHIGCPKNESRCPKNAGRTISRPKNAS